MGPKWEEVTLPKKDGKWLSRLLFWFFWRNTRGSKNISTWSKFTEECPPLLIAESFGYVCLSRAHLLCDRLCSLKTKGSSCSFIVEPGHTGVTISLCIYARAVSPAEKCLKSRENGWARRRYDVKFLNFDEETHHLVGNLELVHRRSLKSDVCS